MARDGRIGIILFSSLAVFVPPASAQDWKDYQDPYGTFSVSHPAQWQVKQNRPGEVEVEESPNTWVRIAMLATNRGEGATANDEVVSYMQSLPEIPKVRDLSQLSLHPDRAVWAYVLPGAQEVKLKGVLAVEVDGILHYGVAYQAPLEKWRQKSETFKKIVSSLRFGEFKIPDWTYGGERGPLPGIVKSKLRRCWSTDAEGILSAELPEGWEEKPGEKRLEFLQSAGPARMVWQVSESTGEKESPEKLVAAAVGASSIDAGGIRERPITEARLFPHPKKPRLPEPPPDPDADVPYETFNRMSFTFQDQGGVAKRGYAVVLLQWTKKKPQPITVELLIFWTDRDRFGAALPVLEQIATSMYGWEGTYSRRDLLSLMSDRNDD